MVFQIREYILPLTNEILKTLYVYQSLETYLLIKKIFKFYF